MARRVLIVDDSLLMRRLVRGALAGNDWEVVGEAGNGNEAAEKYRELLPDVVTLDITMPDCDGIGAIEKIFAIDPNARIVVVSALNQSQLIARAIRAGVKGFVAKPFKPEHLLDAVRECMDEAMLLEGG